ncbi:YdeI/OmpD-associated family protein [Haloarcula onubensis]|uniref:YdeI/OmpD-associated family protein n=1 Tax=Haloarcula onubensis TaxID=2950539 RepID=A0ABU2FTX6_9EURY|nr:YdeI/OmpD-associated family protein [Halomicroarcula sp. S3CR25-11]MDS0283894.1 YdeI/OmpD-associated family protein [Halomicroarcula sp. S3CR25-11]
MDPLFFESQNEFRTWLEEYHDTAEELWVGYYKADAERVGIGYDESVEEALCFGWVDGLVKGIDDETYTRRFTPRSPDSKWSKANKERVSAMIKAGKMTPVGMELVEVAKETGEWAAAYRLGDDHNVPAELEAALRADETAWENFQNFSNTDQHAFIAAVKEAKTDETRQKRIERTVTLAAQDLRAYDENNKRRL